MKVKGAAQALVPPLCLTLSSPHLLDVAGRDLLETLTGLPESQVLSTVLLLQELLGVRGAGWMAVVGRVGV